MSELARARTERGELTLSTRADGAIELRVNGVFVMDTVEVSSETALAQLALAEVAYPRQVLIGGLGLGYTLHAVLGDPRVELVRVAEIEGPLIEWLREGTVPHGPGFLADKRVTVDHIDVAKLVAEALPQTYDLVLLDTDNGPGYLVHTENAGLYRPPFLGEVRRVLSPGGMVAVWSSHESADLHAALAATFDSARTIACPVLLQGREETYWLHVGSLDA